MFTLKNYLPILLIDCNRQLAVASWIIQTTGQENHTIKKRQKWFEFHCSHVFHVKVKQDIFLSVVDILDIESRASRELSGGLVKPFTQTSVGRKEKLRLPFLKNNNIGHWLASTRIIFLPYPLLSLFIMDDIELRNVEASAPLIRSFDPNDSYRNEVVNTDFGNVVVAQQGAEHKKGSSKPVLLTYPDLGLNHITNFQAFFNFSDMKLLLESFTVLHVNPPGQDEGAPTLPEGFIYPTMDQLADQIFAVCQYFNVKSIIGLGVGLGANVLARFALKHSDRVDGLFFINATASKSSWTEWFYQVCFDNFYVGFSLLLLKAMINWCSFSSCISSIESEYVLSGGSGCLSHGHFPSSHPRLPFVASLWLCRQR